MWVEKQNSDATLRRRRGAQLRIVLVGNRLSGLGDASLAAASSVPLLLVRVGVEHAQRLGDLPLRPGRVTVTTFAVWLIVRLHGLALDDPLQM